MIKTTTIETSKLLKEAGFRQDTEYQYKRSRNAESMEYFLDNVKLDKKYSDKFNMDILPSPTTDELLEELPCEGGKYQDWLNISKLDGGRGFSCVYGYPEYSSEEFVNKSLPEALAAMWLWLKKEGLI